MLMIVGLVVLAVAGFYLYLTWNYNYWTKLGIPQDEPKLFFGSIKDATLGKKHYGVIFTEIYNKFKNAAYVGIYSMRSPALLIRDPEIVKSILVKDFYSFEGIGFEIDPKTDPILGINPFFRVGEAWKKRRAQWSANLTLSKVKFLHEVMDDKQKNMVKYLKKHIEERPGEALEARKLVIKYLADVMVHGTLGLKSQSFEEESNVFSRIAESLFESSFIENLGVLAYMIAPWLHNILPVGLVKPWVKKELKGMSQSVVDIRKQHGFLKNDFFESLMKDEKIDIDEISGRIFGFLTEGVETSSGLTSFTLFELASNPQVQSKLRKELDDLAAANKGQLTYDDITNCKYLDMIASETMRLYPAVLVINRISTKPVTFPPAVEGGKPFDVPVGTSVVICNYATHMDPEYFPDPETFNPERFAEGNEINKFAYLPFGEGPRICVGMKLGLTNAKTAVASIIRNFEIRVSPKTHKRPLVIDPKVLVSRAVGELWITFHNLKRD